MKHAIRFGKTKIIDGRRRVYYCGYWVKAYDPPQDSLLAKKQLIEALTRRLFKHVEHGINIPGKRLAEARTQYAAEEDPDRKRVKGAMLAGCLFNRATELVAKLVDIQAMGVTITCENPLMRDCGEHLQEAMQLAACVRHRSGEEGLDELWGEPFKAFSFPINEFYNSRYIKIAQSMQAIDAIAEKVMATFAGVPLFPAVERLVRPFAEAAKVKCETLRTDPDIFDVWTSFVVAGEALSGLTPSLPEGASPLERQRASSGVALLADVRNVISYITRARVPMPKTTMELFERCEAYRRVAALSFSVASVA